MRTHQINRIISTKTYYDGTEEIAIAIEKYYPEIDIEDMGNINTLLQKEIDVAKLNQAKQNELDDINGGSR